MFNSHRPTLAALAWAALATVTSAQEGLPDGAVARLGSVRFQFAGSPPALAFSPDGKLLAVAPRDDGRPLFLWEIATGQVRRTFDAIPDAHELAFSADGSLLAVTSERGVTVFDAATGKPLRHSFPSKKVLAMAFAPRGATLAVAGAFDRGGTPFAVVLWDAATGKELRVLAGHRSPVHALAFSGEGGALVSCAVTVVDPDEKPRTRGEVLRWDLTSGKPTRVLELPANALAYSDAHAHAPVSVFRAVRLSRGGTRLAFPLGSEKALEVWDLKAGKRLREVPADRAACAFTPDGHSLLTGGLSPVARWEADGQDPDPHRFAAGSDQGTFVQAVSPNGKLLATAGDFFLKDAAVHLWDVATGEELRLATGHRDAVLSLAFSAEGGTLVSGGRDRAALCWDLRRGTATRHEAGAPVTAVAVSARGDALAVVRLDHAVDYWLTLKDGAARRLREPRAAQEDDFIQPRTFSGEVGFAGDGAVVVAAANGTAGRHPTSGAGVGPDAVLAGARGRLVSGAVSPTGDRIAGAWATTLGSRGLSLWQAGSGARVWDVPLPSQANVWAVAFSPEGAVVASCETTLIEKTNEWDKVKIVLRETVTGRTILTIDVGAKPTAVALAPGGRAVAWAHGEDWGAPKHAVVWDAAAGKELARLGGHYGPVCAVAFAPDGRLATGSADHTILLWDAKRWRPTADPKATLSPSELEACWKALMAEDAATAWRAMWTLAAAPGQAAALVGARLKPAAATDPERLKELIRDLNSTRFPTREKATAELTRLGLDVEPALRAAAAGDSPLELRRRVEQILEKIERAVLTPQQVRQRRAVTLLEWAATAEARRVLETLARGGDTTAHLAAAALKRLSRAGP